MENNANQLAHELTPVPRGNLPATSTASRFAAPRTAVSSARMDRRTITLMRRAIDRACAALEMDGGVLHWWDDLTGVLYPLVDSDPRLSRPVPELRPGQGVAGRALTQREPVTMKNHMTWGDPSGVRAAVAIPLMRDHRILGVLVVHSYTRRQVEDHQVQALAPLIADMVSLMIAAILRASRVPGF
jgi:GAF domain-containing protein